MAEETIEAKTYIVRMRCDSCKTGFMQPHGAVAYLTDPVTFPHRCDSCGVIQNYIGVQYPYHKIVPKGASLYLDFIPQATGELK